MNPSISTIADFLEQTGTRFRVFDMGRRVIKLSRETFARFENSEVPYPFPLQQHAWLGMLCWNPDEPEERFIWFLKFPLDETGRLAFAARDDFLRRIIESAEKRVEGAGPDFGQEALEDNPHGFKPKEDRMAMFHAKALKSLGLPPSRFFEHARDYFAGKPGWDQWAFVGIQGIADLAARLEEDDHEQIIARAIPHLPDTPLQALCQCLENSSPSITLSDPLAQRLRDEVRGQARPTEVAAMLRGLSHGKATGLRQQILKELFSSPLAVNLEVLAATAGRCWEDLRDEAVAHSFLEALARNEGGQEAFNQIMADLLFIPGMRDPLLAQLRNPERSPELAKAMGALLNHFR